MLRTVTHATWRQMLGALILVVTTGVVRADTIQVKMEKLGFVPAEVTAHVGDTIEWVNSARQGPIMPDKRVNYSSGNVQGYEGGQQEG
jgi:plastocyanin